MTSSLSRSIAVVGDILVVPGSIFLWASTAPVPLLPGADTTVDDANAEGTRGGLILRSVVSFDDDEDDEEVAIDDDFKDVLVVVVVVVVVDDDAAAAAAVVDCVMIFAAD